MKRLILTATVILLLAGIPAGIYLFSDPGIDDVIEEYEGGNYDDALAILKEILPLADYTARERIYYYMIRSENSLADRLETDYDDELTDAALEKKGTPEYKKAVAWIEKKLKSYNEDLGTDLKLHPARRQARIISGGSVYSKFTVRYRGSRYIEDLDFENLKRQMKYNPENTIPAAVIYYQKFPGSSYTAHLIRFIFSALEKGATVPEESRAGLRRLLVSYGKQYSTSLEMNRLFDIKGEGINLRNSPGLKAARVGSASAGDIAIQLAKSMDTTQVGDHRDYWYHITTLEGKKGWIFGKFLTRLDMSRFKESSGEVVWNFDDNFSAWQDSHTPQEWNRIKGAHHDAISFKKRGKGNLVHVSSSGKETAGLYNRYPTTRAFTLETEGRHLKGTFTLAACVDEKKRVFKIDLAEEKVNINGRSIPLHTADWHTYRLESKDGKFATLYIDNEMVSGRIPAVTDPLLNARGIYCLVSPPGSAAEGEIKKVRMK